MLDIYGLNDNPAAILFVSPVSAKGTPLNQHPIGAYYFKTKWHIFNLDGRPVTVGAQFTVNYFSAPDARHFQYSFTRANILADGTALIDHPSLNNNPSAKFSTFLSWDPNSQGSTTNREEISIQYNSAEGKWAVSNTNKKPLFAKVTYNISLETGGGNTTPPIINTDKVSLPINELIVQPNGNANTVSGDINALFMSVWADGQKLPGDCKITTHLNQTELFTLEMGANNLSGRKNNYDPITVRIHSGSLILVPLLNAFITKQSMAFSIDAVTVSGGTGKEATVYTLKLTGAYISSYRQVFNTLEGDLSRIGSSRKAYDEIKIMFTKIEYVNSAGATATDNL